MNTNPTVPLTAPAGKKAAHLSTDGKWRYFPRVPHLLQYVRSGTYYARVVSGGKLFRVSLKTDVYSDAKLKLSDFLKERRTPQGVGESITIGKAVELYRGVIDSDISMKPRSRIYRLTCLRKIRSSWKGIESLELEALTEESCRTWAAELRKTVAPQYFNNVVGTLRLVVNEGIKARVVSGGKAMRNPVDAVAIARIPAKQLTLPEPSIFRNLLDTIRKSSSWGSKAADLVAFLAYSGTRLYTEAAQVSWEDVDWTRKELIIRGDPATGTKNWEVRRIPLIADLENLLLRMKAERESLGVPLQGKLLPIVECPRTLRNSCDRLGITRLRHHDLRHLFATRCIESGVDIPTVARWLGHKDGGALAMRTYGHLRNEHSQEMAKKVQF